MKFNPGIPILHYGKSDEILEIKLLKEIENISFMVLRLGRGVT